MDGKVALVTGGASGIGRAVSERYLAEGARVCVLDRSEVKVRELAAAGEGRVTGVTGDVRRFEDNLRAVRATLDAYGKLDALVVNAGIFDGFVRLERLTGEVMAEAFEDIFSVNVLGTLLSVRAALEPLRQARGTIIFTLSQASFYPDGGGPLYTASKHAALGLMRELAFELAPLVRVNGVAPGGTITRLRVPDCLSGLVEAVDEDEKRKRIARRNPLQLAMEPEDHTAAYVLLASDQSRAITGEVIASDGGLGIRGMSSGAEEGRA
ncbi:MAG: SDR family NAD(P)-dependent oxidoreductase [Alicyclobacillus sp.]|nr:SDR family NAD(P)-dependent oxidoreductase [Alicyclobacillus sp.]